MRSLSVERLQLRGMAGELTGIFFELERLLCSTGTSPEERSPDDLGETPSPAGGAGELRTAVLCGLQDHLQPLIRSFLLAAGCTPEEAACATPALAEELLRAEPAPGAVVELCTTEVPETAADSVGG